MTDLCLLLWSTRRRPLIKQRNAIKFPKFLRLIWYAGGRNQMNHETFQFNFAALDSKPAAEVLCAQLDAECATCLKRFASTRLRLLNRLTVTRCYLRNLPMLWLPKFLPTKVYGSCHGQRDRQKVNLVFCDESALVWVYCLTPLFDWSDLRHVTPQWLTSRLATEDLGQVGVVYTELIRNGRNEGYLSHWWRRYTLPCKTAQKSFWSYAFWLQKCIQSAEL